MEVWIVLLGTEVIGVFEHEADADDEARAITNWAHRGNLEVQVVKAEVQP